MPTGRTSQPRHTLWIRTPRYWRTNSSSRSITLSRTIRRQSLSKCTTTEVNSHADRLSRRCISRRSAVLASSSSLRSAPCPGQSKFQPNIRRQACVQHYPRANRTNMTKAISILLRKADPRKVVAHSQAFIKASTAEANQAERVTYRSPL